MFKFFYLVSFTSSQFGWLHNNHNEFYSILQIPPQCAPWRRLQEWAIPEPNGRFTIVMAMAIGFPVTVRMNTADLVFIINFLPFLQGPVAVLKKDALNSEISAKLQLSRNWTSQPCRLPSHRQSKDDKSVFAKGHVGARVKNRMLQFNETVWTESSVTISLFFPADSGLEELNQLGSFVQARILFKKTLNNLAFSALRLLTRSVS